MLFVFYLDSVLPLNQQFLEVGEVEKMASEDITKLAESLAKAQVGGGQLSFKGKSLKLNTAEDGKRKHLCWGSVSPGYMSVLSQSCVS